MKDWALFGVSFLLGFVTCLVILKEVAVPKHRYQQVVFSLCGADQRPGWRFWVEHKPYLTDEEFERCMPVEPKAESK